MKVLVVEDEVKLGEALRRGLAQDGFVVDLVHNADDGLSYAEADEYDTIILDRMLPGGKDGLEICKKLRDDGVGTPILMLTARDAVVDRVEGLAEGADDYLIKPFSFDELLARIKALQRRPKQISDNKLHIGNATIDFSNKIAEVNESQVDLSKKEFALLEYLASNPRQTKSKEQIMNHVWDFDANILPNTVEVFVRNLRKKLGPDIIKTVRGFGYRLNL